MKQKKFGAGGRHKKKEFEKKNSFASIFFSSKTSNTHSVGNPFGFHDKRKKLSEGGKKNK